MKTIEVVKQVQRRPVKLSEMDAFERKISPAGNLERDSSCCGLMDGNAGFLTVFESGEGHLLLWVVFLLKLLGY